MSGVGSSIGAGASGLAQTVEGRGDRMAVGRRNPPAGAGMGALVSGVALGCDEQANTREPKHINMQRRVGEALAQLADLVELLEVRVFERPIGDGPKCVTPKCSLPDCFHVIANHTEECCNKMYETLTAIERALFERE